MSKKHKLLKHKDFNKDLLFWIKHYLNYRFLTIKKTNVSSDFDLPKISSIILSDSNDTIEKLSKSIDEATKIGLKGMSIHKIACAGFYNYCLDYKFESIKEISNSSIRDYTTRVCDDLTTTRKYDFYSTLIKLFDFISDNNIDEDKKPYLFNISYDSSGRKIKVPFKRVHKKIPNYLTQQQLSKLSQSVVVQEKANKTKNDFERARNILIVRLFIYSGIKTSELLSLQDDDFVLSDGKIVELNIKGSGASKRVIPIPRGKFVEYYNTYTKDKQVGKNNYFFYSPTNPNKKLNSEIIVNLIKKHFKLAKISNTGGATAIRNGYAIYLDRVKHPLVKIQKLMGHSNVRTTRDLVMIDSPELLKTADIFDALDKI